MATKVVHITSVGDVIFSQNPRSKNIRLSVKPDRKITVSFPLHVSFREARRFAEEHHEWIFVQQQKFQTRLPNFSEDSFIQTRFHQVTFRAHEGPLSVKQAKFHLEIRFPSEMELNDPEVVSYIENIMTSIFRWEAKKILPPKVRELADKHHFTYNNISIRNNKSNWGSCSGTNNISLNLNLMKLPDHLVDFIILHELVHTRVKNHGPDFWKMLDSVTDMKARQLTREIKKHSTFLTL